MNLPPGQVQGGIHAGDQDQVYLRRHILDQKGECFVNRLGVDQMIIIQNQDHGDGSRLEVVDQGRQHHIVRGRRDSAQHKYVQYIIRY
jgi:hypothetical protein